MLDDTPKAAFIRDGLVHYPGARETVDYFQTTILESIRKRSRKRMSGRILSRTARAVPSSMGRLSVQLIGHFSHGHKERFRLKAASKRGWHSA